MSAVRCPQCRLPLTDEEADRGSCSSCGHELPKVEAPDPTLKHIPTAKHDPAIPWLVAGVMFLVAMIAVIWGLTRTPTPAESEGPSPGSVAKLQADLDDYRNRELDLREKINVLEAKQTAVWSDKEAALAGANKAKQEVDTAVKDVKDIESKLFAARAEIDRLQLESKQMRDALAGKGDFMQPGVVREIRDGPNNKTLYLSSPRGEYTVDRLIGGMKLKVSGTVKRLIVQGIEGNSTFEATYGLKVEEVRVGPVLGGSAIRLIAPGAHVEMTRVDGNSDAVVRVTGGKLTIDEVVGDSRVTATTKDFNLRGFADGGTTAALSVTLTSGGPLTFGELRGKSKLTVLKFDRGDPDVKIDQGKVGGKRHVQESRVLTRRAARRRSINHDSTKVRQHERRQQSGLNPLNSAVFFSCCRTFVLS